MEEQHMEADDCMDLSDGKNPLFHKPMQVWYALKGRFWFLYINFLIPISYKDMFSFSY